VNNVEDDKEYRSYIKSADKHMKTFIKNAKKVIGSMKEGVLESVNEAFITQIQFDKMKPGQVIKVGKEIWTKMGKPKEHWVEKKSGIINEPNNMFRHFKNSYFKKKKVTVEGKLNEAISPKKAAEVLFDKLAAAKLIGKQNRRRAVGVIEYMLSRMNFNESVNEAKVPYNFSEDELKRVLKLLGRSASTEVKMIKAFEKAFGRKLTRDELFEGKLTKAFKKGDKVKYLGHPGIITNVSDYNGKTYYSVAYNKGTGKTKAKGILSTDGSITEASAKDKFGAPPMNKWWTGDKDALMSAIYHAQRQLPPKTYAEYQKNWKSIVNQLQQKYPAPANIFKKKLTEVQAMNMDTVPYNTIMKMKPGSTIKMKDGKIRTKDKFGNWRADTDPNDIIANRDVIKHMKGMKGFNIGNGRVRIEGKLTDGTITENYLNEAEYITDKFKKGDKIKTNVGTWIITQTNYKPGKKFTSPFVFKGPSMKKLPVNLPSTNSKAVGYKVKDDGKYPITGFLYQHKDITILATVGVDEAVNEAKVSYNFSEEELKRVLKLLGRSASTEVKMIKAFEKALGRKLTRDELFEGKLNEMDINDPILVAIRARKTDLKKKAALPKVKKISTKQYYKLMDAEIDLIDQMKDAAKDYERLDSEMNQDAGQKGDAWTDADANRYGGDLNKLQTKIEKLAKQKLAVKKQIMNYRIN